MRKEDSKLLFEILEQTYYGNWSYAIERYKELNASPAELREYIPKLTEEEKEDLIMLGYYAREQKQEGNQSCKEKP